MDIDKLVHNIQTIDWGPLLSLDMDNAAVGFTNAIMNAAKDVIPTKIVTIQHTDKPWVTSQLKKHIRKRDRLFRAAKRTQNPHDWNKWKDQRNYVTDLNKTLKNAYLQQQVHYLTESRQSPQRYHTILKRIIGTLFSYIHYQYHHTN